MVSRIGWLGYISQTIIQFTTNLLNYQIYLEKMGINNTIICIQSSSYIILITLYVNLYPKYYTFIKVKILKWVKNRSIQSLRI
jgi:hypothetical protein